jgi:hypothetical protein
MQQHGIHLQGTTTVVITLFDYHSNDAIIAIITIVGIIPSPLHAVCECPTNSTKPWALGHGAFASFLNFPVE